MALAYVDKGTLAAGTTSVAPTYQTITAGNLVVLVVTGKYPSNFPSTPSGFTHVNTASSNLGEAAGADAGDVWASVYTKIGTGGESGTQSVTITSGNSALGQIFQVSCAGGQTFQIASAVGRDTADDSSMSITFDSDPGVTSGDLILLATAGNSDSGGVSSLSLSQTGITYGAITQRELTGTTQGDDHRIIVHTVPVNSGTSSAAPVWSFTYGINATFCGVFVRIREVSAAVTGGLTTTDADDALAATGTSPSLGVLATTDADDTVSSAGVVPVFGALNTTDANDTCASTGTPGTTGLGARLLINRSLLFGGLVHTTNFTRRKLNSPRD